MVGKKEKEVGDKGVGGKCGRGMVAKSGVNTQQVNHPPYCK
jgi:hypothetical protein